MRLRQGLRRPGPDRPVRQRLLGLVGVFTALLWIDNLSEHYRGGFRDRLMWIPIVVAPVAAVTSLAASRSERRSIGWAAAVAAALQGGVALVGVARHHRGITARVGHGPRMYVFHAWFGPPIFAPLQYLGFAGLGLLGGLPRRVLEPLTNVLPLERLLPLYVAVSIPPLWGEIAYLHWRGSFQNRAQFVPLFWLPLVGGAALAAAIAPGRIGRRAYRLLPTSLGSLGATGIALYAYGVHRRYGGWDRKVALFNWLSGPPVPAPLQIVGLGLIARTGRQHDR
ncbi:MAG: hypothetical protein H0X16_02145 [Chloroflexi bacterium]|nr:hypothetical protein [Chloroflexota bacterium]